MGMIRMRVRCVVMMVVIMVVGVPMGMIVVVPRILRLEPAKTRAERVTQRTVRDV